MFSGRPGIHALLSALVMGFAFLASSPARGDVGTACGRQSLSGQRVALVVANARYDGYSWDPLANAANDAELVCTSLTDAGFSVRVVVDADHAAFVQALDRFKTEIGQASQVVFYFAGHGFQYSQRNYLVPIGAPPITRRADLDRRYVTLETIVATIVPRDAVAMFLIDACRTASPVVQLEDLPATAVDGSVGPVGLLSLPRGAVLYSTAIGSPAYDGAPAGATVSPFANAVARYLRVPAPITALFGAIESEVPELTTGMPQGVQEPFHYGRRLQGIYLMQPQALDMSTVASPAPSPSPTVTPPSPSLASPSGGASMAVIRGAGSPARVPLNLSMDRLAIEDEPIVVARLLVERTPADLWRLAQSGDRQAQHILGYMLSFGVGVTVDRVMARRLLEQSAATGYAPAQLELGYFLLSSGTTDADRREAERLYRAAASAGYAKAKTHLAYQLSVGGFGLVDLPAARLLYTDAARAGHPAAMFFAAIGGGADARSEMIGRLEAVARAGNRDGNLWLCELAYLSNDVAARFNDCAIAARGSLSGDDDPAASGAAARAMAIVALAYQRGQGVPANPAIAMIWARRAIEHPALSPDLRVQLTAMLGE